MVLTEFLDERSAHVPVQIFATDLSDTVSLQRARDGIYPENIEAEVSPERLRRFFAKQDSKYRIHKSLRDMCVFAKQNVASDPPFSRVDLISCRNLLIYLATPLQKRVIPTFHYALNPNGYLLLGASETIGSFGDLFSLVDHKHRLYVKKEAATVRPYPHFSAEELHGGLALAGKSTGAAGAIDWHREVDRMMLGDYAPVGALVNSDFDVLHFRGRTADFLTPPAGEATLNVLRMAREGLAVELRNALYECRQRQSEIRRDNIRVRTNSHTREIVLRVMPVKLPKVRDQCYLVLFEPAGTTAGSTAAPTSDIASESSTTERRGGFTGWLQQKIFPAGTQAERHMAADARELQQLRQELGSTREYLQSVIEEQDAANEELKSANEEILSANEELQSTNEELETAKEELQSVNEELTTINEQLHTRNTELTRLNDDFTNLLNSANIPMVLLGIDHRIRRFTTAAAKHLAMVPGDVGRPISNLKLPLDIPDLEGLLADVVDTVRPYVRDLPEQSGQSFSLRIYPYRTADNKIDGAVVVLIDVTELRRGEEALSRLASIVSSSDDAIVGKTPEGVLTTWNRGAERLYGYPASEVIGKSVGILAAPGHENEFAGIMERIRRGEVVEPFETVRRRKDGSLIDVSIRISAVHNAAGEIVGASAIARDITASKRQAVELKVADRRKNEFLAMLAHELRNPLAPLRTGLQVLQMLGDSSPDSAKIRESMDRQVRHMSRLIDDLLDVSRITSGHIELRKETVDLGAVIAEIANESRDAIETAGLTLTVNLPPTPLTVYADPVRIAQIIENLLTNSVKYTDRGGRITIALKRDRAHAIVEVCDTGIGISQEMLPLIWELFSQADTTADRFRSGLGIGLTLVRRLVEMHDGRVEARSDGKECGSEFLIYLPLAVGAASTAKRPEAEPHTSELSKRSILIVDDNSDAATSLATLLGLMGNTVDVASNGEDALAKVKRHRPEIVLLDIGLPGISGYEIARRLRQLSGSDQMLLIAVTGYGSDDDRRQALVSGFDGHLIKPLDIRDLQELLGRLEPKPQSR
jgi:two-component system CheB/CheR fusion protein